MDVRPELPEERDHGVADGVMLLNTLRGGSDLKGPRASLCACGCGKPHHNAVSRVVEGRGGNRILWYRTMSCRNSHKRRL
jgi:hypothetical protein